MDSTHRPLILDPTDAGQKSAILKLVDDPRVAVLNTIDRQLTDLIQIRSPGCKRGETELVAAVGDHLGAIPREDYGRWVYYPWSNRLVHLLPPEEFREVRTDRNRYKITSDEQARLAQRCIAIVGLSAGHAIAQTLAQEGVGGQFRLADFDTVDLSNLNRLRAGVHELGENKAVVAARHIAEIDPYLEVTVYVEGITERNMNEFLSGADLIFEECDDVYTKLRLRERARELGIPVIMVTSNRGCIDVERFDLEPSRPLLHGRLASLTADDIQQLPAAERLALVLRIVDESQCSERDRASLAAIGKTISTWPQLGSMIALGGAVATDVARRLLLGEFRRSGRFFVDMEQLVNDEAPRFDVSP